MQNEELEGVTSHTADVLPEGTDFRFEAKCGCSMYEEALYMGRKRHYSVCAQHRDLYPNLLPDEVGEKLWRNY